MPESRPLRSGDPDQVGPYRLTGFLGRGGHGAVYLGEGPDGRAAAVKVLDAEWAEDPGFRRRFEREARAAQRVASFCTAQVLDADVEAERPYIVSEYIPGPTLREDVVERGPRTGADLHRLAVATATALVAIHEAGIVHRDFKPANVLLAPDGARVIDFGIARVADVTGSHSQTVIGTPGYMAPEQIAGEPDTATIGPPADVFAWGAVMLFAATGRNAFGGDSIPRVMHQIMHGEPDLSGVEKRWRDLIARCLSKNPDDRPASSDLLLTLLGRADTTGAAGATGGSPPPPAPDPTPPTDVAHGAGGTPETGTGPATSAPTPGRRRGRVLIAAGIAVVLLLAAAGSAVAYRMLTGGGDPRAGRNPAPAADPPSSGERAGPASPGPTSAKDDATVAPDRDKGDGKDKGDDKGDKEPDDDSSSGPGFRAKFAGSWTGSERDGDKGHEMTIREDSNTASLAGPDGSCTWTFTLVRENERGGYNAKVASDRGCGPHTTASLWLPNGNPGRLTIHLHGVPDHHEARWFDLVRV